ncbi:MAG: SDR family oxidoreductase [Acidobacteria bacterium]|nr:SDR family oxidoreductase [Acidobacteriota bacterium]
MSKLQDRVAVITGGNSGIGLATAEAFRREGAQVAIFGRNRKTLEAAVAQVGGDTLGVVGDVTSGEDLDRLFSAVREKWGRIDVLFVNAGIAEFRPFEASDESFFDRIFDVNVKGAYFTVQKALPLLAPGASVILTTSVVNVKGMADTSVYSATKAALRSLARTLSQELTPKGIRVNAVSPGPIETPIFGRMGLSDDEKAGMEGRIAQAVPLKRMGRASEIAEPVVFLASDASTYIVGAELPVDGGMGQI